MSKNLEIKFNEEIYRDDRLYVMNLSKGILERNNEKTEKYILITYRNTVDLRAVRQDIFDNIDEAKDYIKKVEFETPLISLNGKPLNISDIEDKWSYWLNWLDKKNLYSAITEYQNLPYWQNSNGGEFGLNNYVSVVAVNKDDLVPQSNKDIN